MSLRRRLVFVTGAFGLVALAVLLWAPTVGSTPVSLARAFDRRIPWADNVDAQIFFVARLPRVLAGSLIGAALAAAGIPGGPINDMAAVFADPQVIARGLRIDSEGMPGVASPIVIDGRRQLADRPSPPLPSL